MGQVALGLRSLFIRLAVFFVMAALLAWALGGTLWPRTEEHLYESLNWEGRDWSWRQSIGGSVPGHIAWQMVSIDGEKKAVPIDDRIWRSGAGPIIAEGTLYFAGLGSDARWSLLAIDPAALTANTLLVVPDRLAAERQLARLAAGLELQDLATIERDRAVVLDPPAHVVDKAEGSEVP